MTELTDLADAPPDGPVALDGHPYGRGFTAGLGLVLEGADADRVGAWADIGSGHHQEAGIVHGGWYTAVVETVASIGAWHARPDERSLVVGVSNYTEFFRPHRSGRIEVEALPVHQGRSQQVWEVRMTRASDGKLVARGQLRLQHVVDSGR